MTEAISMKLSIIGAGSWGAAMALTLQRSGHEVLIYSNRNKVIEGFNLTFNISDVKDSQAIFIAIPAQKIRTLLQELAQIGLNKDVTIIICSKGIEFGSNKLLAELVQEFVPNEVGILSGPNFASEILRNLPAATELCFSDLKRAQYFANILSHQNFCIYPSDDMISIQVSGALKNILAIACGIVRGKDLGENAVAALITRGIYEIGKLSIAMGGRKESLLGLASIGDISLSCNSAISRNMQFGYNLAKNSESKSVNLVEGFYTSKVIPELCKTFKVDLPICMAVFAVLHGGGDIENEVHKILSRNLN